MRAAVHERADLLVGEAAGQVAHDVDVDVRQRQRVLHPLVAALVAIAGGRGDDVGRHHGIQHRLAAVGGPDHPLELAQLDVLEDVAAGAGGQAAQDHAVLVVAGEHDDLGGRGHLAHALAHGGAVAVLEADVDQHHVGPLLGGDANRLAAGADVGDDLHVGLHLQGGA